MYWPCVDLNGMEHELDIDEVCIIEQHENKRELIRMITVRGTFLFVLRGSLENALRLFEQFGFADLNGGSLVNMKLMISIDKELGLVYFDDNLCVQVSRRNLPKVEYLPKR